MNVENSQKRSTATKEIQEFLRRLTTDDIPDMAKHGFDCKTGERMASQVDVTVDDADGSILVDLDLDCTALVPLATLLSRVGRADRYSEFERRLREECPEL